jgi:hypothetical protein
MLPGPTYVYECSKCHGLFRRRSISSGNTFNARYRSDGRMDAPMLPTTSLLTACPHCKSPVFWPETNAVASYETYIPRFFSTSESDPTQLEYVKQQFELETKYRGAPEYAEATSTQVAAFLKNNELSDKHEHSLRMQFWWLTNDERARGKSDALSTEERANLKKLLQLVGQGSDSMMLLIAEIYRELGQFEEAKRCLDFDFQGNQAAMAEQLMRAIDEENILPFSFVSRDNQYNYEYAWIERRYSPEDPSKYNFADLNPPVFKISNRDWWVKVLGMLCHNWALIEWNSGGSATVYFFQDTPHGDRPAIIDSLEFQSVLQARQALFNNDFKILKSYPGPWMGCEPKGFVYDNRNAGNHIYSKLGFWQNHDI